MVKDIKNYNVEGECFEDSLFQNSSFIIQPYRRKYLSGYMSRMSRDDTSQLWDDNVASVLEEQGFRIEDSPRSEYSVNKLYQALQKYAPELAPKVSMDNRAVVHGVKLAYSCFAKPKDQLSLEALPLTPRSVLSITSNRSGSAGLTAWGQTKAESYVRAFERSVQQIKGEKKPDPCVAFKRTQFNGKTRLVWGYPYAMTAIEGLFARPLIDKFKQKITPMTFAKSTLQIGAELRCQSYANEWAYSTDVSSFDSALSGDLIRVAFNILKTWFDLSAIEPTTQAPYSLAWDMVVDYFIHTPIVMPNGYVYFGKRHGVPSGSYFTQLIDSICNVIICGAISYHFNLNVDKGSINVLGDDLLFWSNRDVDLEDIASYGSRLFGITLNADKSRKFRSGSMVHYLGRDWYDGVPTLDESEILKRMAQPETFRKYEGDPAARQRQVHLLLLSYAAVYYHGSEILDSLQRGKHMFNVGPKDMESVWIGTDSKAELPDEFTSGLVRYLRKYHRTHKDTAPVAIQFMK